MSSLRQETTEMLRPAFAVRLHRGFGATKGYGWQASPDDNVGKWETAGAKDGLNGRDARSTVANIAADGFDVGGDDPLP
jgi:hypothetical protein